MRWYSFARDVRFTGEEFHPTSQETTALAVEEWGTPDRTLSAIDLPCFGGFRHLADDPPKPWRLRTEALPTPPK